MMHNFYDNHTRHHTLIGVTGTNGKTSVATLLYALFEKMGYRCGLISTVEIRIHTEVYPSTHTTPDIVNLYRILYEMYLQHCSYVFMEVSSHSIVQQRIEGLRYTGGIFTNLTHDHLDYHGDFKSYLLAKKMFFDHLDAEAFAISNWDDKNGKVMLQNCKAKQIRYACKDMADYRAKILSSDFSGLHLKFNDKEWHSKLIGEFNAYNLLAVFATAMELGKNEEEVLQAMSDLENVEGRFDWFKDPKTDCIGVVDYAHTPDAVEKILDQLIHLRKPNQEIITVIGCGGNRDKTKRPLMAKIAVDKSNRVIFTSDNPRDEDPEIIVKEMEEGVEVEDVSKYSIVIDRDQAIKTACIMAKPGSIILIAGKGHEKYQESKGIKFPFDDKQKLKSYLMKL
jgi:UDP-N-acetylmuramoyl-L-alanyl-D-glutamate--2,6-diaminopimelate ligase